jgi:hypothetical protein
MAEIVIKLANGELAGKTAQSIAKEINAAAVAAKKAEVGTKDWIDAHAKLDRAKKLQQDLSEQVRATTTASNSLKQSFGGILNQIPGFSQISGVLGQAKGGVGGLTSGFGLLRGAIIATGIGALVIAIMGLVSWFTKTEKGANIVSGVFKGMGAVLDTLLSKIWNIGDTLKEFLANPIQFFKNLGKDIASAAKEGYDLVQVFDDIEDRQRDLEVRSKEQDIEIDRLLLQAKNAGKTYEEKLAILEKADDMTRASYREQLALSKEYLDAVEREVAAAEKNGTFGDDLADKRKDAKIAYLNLVQEEVTTEEKIANRREQILGKIDKANEKAAAQKEKQNEKEAKDLADSLKVLEDMRVKSIQDSEAQEIAAVELKFKRDLEQSTLHGEQKAELEKLIEETKGQEIQVIKDKYAALALQADKKSFQEKISNLDLQMEQETNLLTQQFLAKQLTDQQYADLTAQAIIKSEQQKLNLIRATFGEQSAEYQKGFASLLNKQKVFSDESAKTTEELAKRNSQAVTGSLSVFAGFLGTMAGLYEQGTQQYKAFATAQAVISTIQGAINAYTSALAIPYVGEILAPIAAGAALAAGYAQVNKIQQTKIAAPVKKEKGGLLSGRRHSQGGIHIEAEDGEFIFSRKAVSAIGVDHLNSVNNHYTRKFSSGGPVSPFADRGPIRSSAASSATLATDDRMSRLETAFNNYASKVDRWASTIKVQNVVTETESALKTVNRIREDADI